MITHYLLKQYKVDFPTQHQFDVRRVLFIILTLGLDLGVSLTILSICTKLFTQ